MIFFMTILKIDIEVFFLTLGSVMKMIFILGPIIFFRNIAMFLFNMVFSLFMLLLSFLWIFLLVNLFIFNLLKVQGWFSSSDRFIMFTFLLFMVASQLAINLLVFILNIPCLLVLFVDIWEIRIFLGYCSSLFKFHFRNSQLNRNYKI